MAWASGVILFQKCNHPLRKDSGLSAQILPRYRSIPSAFTELDYTSYRRSRREE
jgi:hypothetical protein